MPKNYYSFLLRVFKVGSSQDGQWLATLQEPHTLKVFSFTNLDLLHSFLLKLQNPDLVGEDALELSGTEENGKIDED
jgi:hypothetical protein